MNIRKFSASGTVWKLAGIVCGVILLALPVFALASHTEDGEDNGGTTSIEGVKENTSGDPVEGWEIRLYDDSGETIIHFAETDEDGRYRFTAVAEGVYFVCEDEAEDWEQSSPTESDTLEGDVELSECINGTMGYEVKVEAAHANSIFVGLDFVNSADGDDEEDDVDEDQDEEGDTDEDDQEDEDNEDEDLFVGWAVGPAMTVRTGERVTFAAAANGTAPHTFSWSGDVSGAGLSVSTSFATPGTRTGIVTATDGEGRTGTATYSVDVVASGGIGGAPGEGPIGQAPPATPPTDTDTDGETTPNTATPTEEGDEEAEEGEGAAGGMFSRDNLWWIVLAVIVIALAAYYLWERQRGVRGPGGGKQQPPAAPPAT